MATYNRAHLISESFDSISNQTFTNWECLIIDDGSFDNSQAVIEGFSKEDSRFQYFQRPDTYLKGLPGCRNYGLDLAKGTFIIFFDDDDIVHPKNLEVCLETLGKTGVDFCHFNKRSFVENIPDYPEITDVISSYPIGCSEIEKVVTNQIALASCTVLWKNHCFHSVRFLEYLNYAEEWECYIRILLEGFEGVGMSEILYFNRKHTDSNTGEFWEGNKKRRNSNEKAIKLVIENLQNRDLLSPYLIRHFIQMSVFFKNRTILNFILAKSNMNNVKKIKYRLLYKFYPILVLGHRTKRLLKN